MKLIAINGSPRKKGNTSILISTIFKVMNKNGIETEMISIGGKPIRGCLACGMCKKNMDKQCIQTGDEINEIIKKIDDADGLILASPVYFTDVTSEMKAFIDRVGYVARANGHIFRRKVGAAVVSVRRGGSLHTYDTLNHFFLIGEMIVPGSTYWNFGMGSKIGEVENDTEGINTMKNLGENIAWLMKKLS